MVSGNRNSILESIHGRGDRYRTAQGFVLKERDREYRYVVGMNYWEQFSNALHNFFALACVAGEWRATLVRPFTSHSRLYGLKDVFLDEHFNGSDSAHDLGLILEPNSVDSVLGNVGLGRAASLKEMLEFGDRKLIFLHFMFSVSNREYEISSMATRLFLRDSFKRSSMVDCSEETELRTLARLVASNLNSQLGKGSKSRFTPHKYVCVNATRGVTVREIEREGGFERGNASIIVINWRGLGNGSNLVHSSKGVHPNKRVAIVDSACLDKRKRGKKFDIKFSKTIVESTESYLKELGVREREFLAVHFRSEKLSFRQSRFPRLLQNCVLEALQKRDEIVSRVGGVGGRSLRVLYFGDVGEFGSETCKKCSSNSQMDRMMQKYKFTLSHFSPSKHNLPPDRGLVAAVEMSVMSRAGHMILVGGGAFQSQLQLRFNARRYGNVGNGNEVVTLCSNDQQARETTMRFSPPAH